MHDAQLLSHATHRVFSALLLPLPHVPVKYWLLAQLVRQVEQTRLLVVVGCLDVYSLEAQLLTALHAPRLVWSWYCVMPLHEVHTRSDEGVLALEINVPAGHVRMAVHAVAVCSALLINVLLGHALHTRLLV